MASVLVGVQVLGHSNKLRASSGHKRNGSLFSNRWAGQIKEDSIGCGWLGAWIGWMGQSGIGRRNGPDLAAAPCPEKEKIVHTRQFHQFRGSVNATASPLNTTRKGPGEGN